MTSRRYIILSIIYIASYYIVMYHYDEDNHSIIHNPYIVLFLSTFIFIYVIKYQENKNCTKNKLENKYLLSQSLFYSLLALLSHNIYNFLIEKECVSIINNTISNISNATYIFEGLFTAGIVLLVNQLSYKFYPKCT